MVTALKTGSSPESVGSFQCVAMGGETIFGYPKDTPCVVCKETLGSKGDPIMFRQGAVPVIVCSKECVTAFQKDPTKYRFKP